MAAKRKSMRKAKTPTAAQAAAMRKSFIAIMAAHKKLDLMINQHRAKVSPMFYAY